MEEGSSMWRRHASSWSPRCRTAAPCRTDGTCARFRTQRGLQAAPPWPGARSGTTGNQPREGRQAQAGKIWTHQSMFDRRMAFEGPCRCVIQGSQIEVGDVSVPGRNSIINVGGRPGKGRRKQPALARRPADSAARRLGGPAARTGRAKNGTKDTARRYRRAMQTAR
jgi:hypothetical protein